MRSFSLVGLLVTVCIGLLIFAKYEIPVAKNSQPARNEAQQMSGHGETGEDAGRSITLEPYPKGGNELKGWTVKAIEAGGPMEKYYGLAIGDEIIKIGDLDVNTFNGDDTGANLTQEGFEKKKPITVLRGGDKTPIILPKGANPDGSSNLPNPLNNLHLPGQQ